MFRNKGLSSYIKSRFVTTKKQQRSSSEIFFSISMLSNSFVYFQLEAPFLKSLLIAKVTSKTLTHWLLELQKVRFWTFWWFSGWVALIWSKMHLERDSLPFLSLASRFTTFWLARAQKSKFRDEKVTYVFRLFEFWIFFRVSFSSFSFLFAAVIDLLLGLLAVKKLLRKRLRDGNFYHGAARCSGRKFCSEFYTQLFEHFCTYLRIHLADNSDLGIIGKIFSSCRSWV